MAVRTEGSWIFGPYGLVWAASDIGFADGRWHEIVPKPRIVATPASPADGPMLAAAPDLYEALNKLQHAYVNLMEIGRDRIRSLGGDCDPVDVMEAGDPTLKIARAALAKARGEAE